MTPRARGIIFNPLGHVLVVTGLYGGVYFPGGGFEPSDSELSATVVREVMEETGVTVGTVIAYLGTDDGDNHFFVGLSPSRTAAPVDPEHEVTDARWVPVQTAIQDIAGSTSRHMITDLSMLRRAYDTVRRL